MRKFLRTILYIVFLLFQSWFAKALVAENIDDLPNHLRDLGKFLELNDSLHCFCCCCTGELGYDGPLYDRFLHMTDDMLGPSPMHIKYLSYVYDGFCI